MDFFELKDGEMHAEGVALSAIARDVGTPAYIYSAPLVREAWRRLDRAFDPGRHRLDWEARAADGGGRLRSAGRGHCPFAVGPTVQVAQLDRSGDWCLFLRHLPVA